MTLNYDTSGVGQNGVATTHMLPAATLTQYSRHYGQALPGYSVPGTPWVTPYLVQTAPPHMQQVDVSFCTDSVCSFVAHSLCIICVSPDTIHKFRILLLSRKMVHIFHYALCPNVES